MSEPSQRRNKVQSVETTFRLLYQMAELGGQGTLTEIAEASGLAPAKAHRYLASLIKADFVKQSTSSGSYSLAGGAIKVGLAAIHQVDFANVVMETLPAVRDACGFSVFAAVPGNKGPTVINQIESMHDVTVNVRVGSVLPVLSSATGRVFAAFSNDPQLALLIDEEILHMRRHKLALPDMPLEELQNYLNSVRSQGYAKIVGTLLQGVSAYSVPVFNHHRELAGAITLLGPDLAFTPARESEVLHHLPIAGRRSSELLGYDGRKQMNQSSTTSRL